MPVTQSTPPPDDAQITLEQARRVIRKHQQTLRKQGDPRDSGHRDQRRHTSSPSYSDSGSSYTYQSSNSKRRHPGGSPHVPKRKPPPDNKGEHTPARTNKNLHGDPAVRQTQHEGFPAAHHHRRPAIRTQLADHATSSGPPGLPQADRGRRPANVTHEATGTTRRRPPSADHSGSRDQQNPPMATSSKERHTQT